MTAVRLRPLAALLLTTLALGAWAHGQPASPPPDPAREARLRWFREAKYGLFIHWGLYAIPAGEWKGKRVPGIGEWIMYRAGSRSPSTSSWRRSGTRSGSTRTPGPSSRRTPG